VRLRHSKVLDKVCKVLQVAGPHDEPPRTPVLLVLFLLVAAGRGRDLEGNKVCLAVRDTEPLQRNEREVVKALEFVLKLLHGPDTLGLSLGNQDPIIEEVDGAVLAARRPSLLVILAHVEVRHVPAVS